MVSSLDSITALFSKGRMIQSLSKERPCGNQSTATQSTAMKGLSVEMLTKYVKGTLTRNYWQDGIASIFI